jgi:hypothetical protein
MLVIGQAFSAFVGSGGKKSQADCAEATLLNVYPVCHLCDAAFGSSSSVFNLLSDECVLREQNILERSVGSKPIDVTLYILLLSMLIP